MTKRLKLTGIQHKALLANLDDYRKDKVNGVINQEAIDNLAGTFEGDDSETQVLAESLLSGKIGFLKPSRSDKIKSSTRRKK